jgi:PIN domain nuclease of toxin-antitoxin system
VINLDTHILVFALAGTLTEDERAILSADQWGISAIVLWELAKLVQLGRIELDLASPEFTQALSTIRVWPLDLAVCRQSTQLDFTGDPADELIAATSIVHRAPLLTRDRRILASAVVPVAALPAERARDRAREQHGGSIGAPSE